MKKSAYNIGKILDMVSRDQESRHRRTTNQEGFQNGKTKNIVRGLVCHIHIIDLAAHVENGSQVTLPRKRNHHEFMHDLRR
jgi:hypothetical protein